MGHHLGELPSMVTLGLEMQHARSASWDRLFVHGRLLTILGQPSRQTRHLIRKLIWEGRVL